MGTVTNEKPPYGVCCFVTRIHRKTSVSLNSSAVRVLYNSLRGGKRSEAPGIRGSAVVSRGLPHFSIDFSIVSKCPERECMYRF